MTESAPDDLTPRILRLSRRRTTPAFVAAVLLTAVSGYGLARGQYAVGGLGLAFFGAFGIPATGAYLIRPSTLTLDRRSFTIRMLLGRPVSRTWVECGPFAPRGLPLLPRQFVGYSTRRTDQAALRAVSRRLVGDDEAIMAGFGGLSAKELTRVLNAFRDAALAAPDEIESHE